MTRGREGRGGDRPGFHALLGHVEVGVALERVEDEPQATAAGVGKVRVVVGSNDALERLLEGSSGPRGGRLRGEEGLLPALGGQTVHEEQLEEEEAVVQVEDGGQGPGGGRRGVRRSGDFGLHP